MRKLFIKEGCPLCKEIMRAVHKFNSTVMAGEEIDVVWNPGPEWDKIIDGCMDEVNTKEYPVLVFDGMAFVLADIHEIYYFMLEELNEKNGD